MKSAVHVPHAEWLILPCSALACTHDFKDFLSSIPVFCCSAARPSPCFDTMPHIVACVCSPLCHHLYTIFHIGSEIALSDRMLNLSFAGFPRCAFTLTKKVAVPAAILFCSISMAAARISASGAPTHVALPPSPIHLLTAFNNDWLSHKYSNGSSISVSRSASKNAADSGWFELEPSSSRPTLHCCSFRFSSQIIISCSHFALFVWTVTCRYLALKPIASKHAYLCAHPVIAFSPFQSHLTFVFSSWYSGRFLQSCFLLVCHMAILVNPARSILFAHCAFDVVLSPPRLPAHWLPFASFLIRLLSCFWFGLLAAVWEDFVSIDFKQALLFVFFPRPAPNHPILRLAHLFRPLLLLWFR